ncbi:MAG: hypothetical protein HYZ75_07180 [Elusimicrobia bacterium]|nr:hypothetical protein [Elusimicrobiota bacterium]
MRTPPLPPEAGSPSRPAPRGVFRRVCAVVLSLALACPVPAGAADDQAIVSEDVFRAQPGSGADTSLWIFDGRGWVDPVTNEYYTEAQFQALRNPTPPSPAQAAPVSASPPEVQTPAASVSATPNPLAVAAPAPAAAAGPATDAPGALAAGPSPATPAGQPAQGPAAQRQAPALRENMAGAGKTVGEAGKRIGVAAAPGAAKSEGGGGIGAAPAGGLGLFFDGREGGGGEEQLAAVGVPNLGAASGAAEVRPAYLPRASGPAGFRSDIELSIEGLPVPEQQILKKRDFTAPRSATLLGGGASERIPAAWQAAYPPAFDIAGRILGRGPSAPVEPSPLGHVLSAAPLPARLDAAAPQVIPAEGASAKDLLETLAALDPAKDKAAYDAAVAVLTRRAGEILPQLKAILLRARGSDIAGAMRILAAMGTPGLGLAQELLEAGPIGRRRAAAALARMAPFDARKAAGLVPPLRALLTQRFKDGGDEIKADAARALAKIGPAARAALPDLLGPAASYARLKSGSDWIAGEERKFGEFGLSRQFSEAAFEAVAALDPDASRFLSAVVSGSVSAPAAAERAGPASGRNPFGQGPDEGERLDKEAQRQFEQDGLWVMQLMSRRGAALQVPAAALERQLAGGYDEDASFDARQRIDAAELLARLYPERQAAAIAELRKVVEGTGLADVLRWAGEALGRLDAPGPAALRLAEDLSAPDKSPGRRWRDQYRPDAVRLLAKLGGGAAFARLRSYASSPAAKGHPLTGAAPPETDPKVRRAAAAALIALIPTEPQAAGALTAVLLDPDGAAAASALEVLESMELPRAALPGLVFALTKDADAGTLGWQSALSDSMRARVVALTEGLLEGGSPEAALFQAMRDSRYREVRALSRRALGALLLDADAGKAIRTLAEAWRGENLARAPEETQVVALLAAFAVERTDAAGALVPALYRSAETAEAAREVLRAMGPRAFEALNAGWRERDVPDRQLSLLAHSGSEGLRIVAGIVADRSLPMSLRRAALGGLGVGDSHTRRVEIEETLVPVLAQIVLQGEEGLWKSSTKALELIGGRAAGKALLAAFEKFRGGDTPGDRERATAFLVFAAKNPDLDVVKLLGEEVDRTSGAQRSSYLVALAPLDPGAVRTHLAGEGAPSLSQIAAASEGDLQREAMDLLIAKIPALSESEIRRAFGQPRLPESAGATAALILRLKSDDELVRMAALDALAEHAAPDDALETALVAAVLRPRPRVGYTVRESAINAIGRLAERFPGWRLESAAAALLKVEAESTLLAAVLGKLGWRAGPESILVLDKQRAEIKATPGVIRRQETIDDVSAAIEKIRAELAAPPPIPQAVVYGPQEKAAGPRPEDPSLRLFVADGPGIGLVDPYAFPGAAARIAALGPAAREFVPDLKRAAAGLFIVSAPRSGETPEASAAVVRAAAMKALGRIEPDTLASLAAGVAAELEETPGAGLLEIAGRALRASAAEMGLPIPLLATESWDEEMERAFAALEAAGEVLWHRKTVFIDARGRKHVGYAHQKENGAWQFVTEDGFLAALAPDGDRLATDLSSGAGVRRQADGTVARMDSEGGFSLVEMVPAPPSWRDLPGVPSISPRLARETVSWSAPDSESGETVIRFHGTETIAPRGATVLFEDGRVRIFRKDANGTMLPLAWLEREDGLGLTTIFRYEVLQGGLGVIRERLKGLKLEGEGKKVIFFPEAVAGLRAGSLDLAGLPAELLSSADRRAFEGFFDAYASFAGDSGVAPEVERAFRGESWTDEEGTRFSWQVGGFNLVRDADAKQRLQLLVLETVERYGFPAKINALQLYVEAKKDGFDVVSARESGKLEVHAFRRAGSGGSVTVERLVLDERHGSEGRLRTRLGEKFSSMGAGVWRTTEMGLPSSVEVPDPVLGAIGQGVDVVFSPFQTILYGVVGLGKLGIGRGAGAMGYEDTELIYASDGIHTMGQGRFMQWADYYGNGLEGRERDVDVQRKVLAALSPRQRQAYRATMEAEFERRERKRTGRFYFLADRFAEDADLAVTAAQVLGQGNRARLYMESGREAYERGDHGGFVRNYAMGGVYVGGEMFIVSAGFGLIVSGPVRVALAARNLTAAAQILSAAETVVFVGPMLINTVDALGDLRTESDPEFRWQHFDRAFEGSVGVLGLFAGWAWGRMEGSAEPALSVKAERALESLGIKPAEIQGKPVAEVRELVDRAYRRRLTKGAHPDIWESLPPGPKRAAGEASYKAVREAQGTLLSLLDVGSLEGAPPPAPRGEGGSLFSRLAAWLFPAGKAAAPSAPRAGSGLLPGPAAEVAGRAPPARTTSKQVVDSLKDFLAAPEGDWTAKHLANLLAREGVAAERGLTKEQALGRIREALESGDIEIGELAPEMAAGFDPKTGRITINRSFADAPPELLRGALLHELIHRAFPKSYEIVAHRIENYVYDRWGWRSDPAVETAYGRGVAARRAAERRGDYRRILEAYPENQLGPLETRKKLQPLLEDLRWAAKTLGELYREIDAGTLKAEGIEARLGEKAAARRGADGAQARRDVALIKELLNETNPETLSGGRGLAAVERGLEEAGSRLELVENDLRRLRSESAAGRKLAAEPSVEGAGSAHLDKVVADVTPLRSGAFADVSVSKIAPDVVVKVGKAFPDSPALNAVWEADRARVEAIAARLGSTVEVVNGVALKRLDLPVTPYLFRDGRVLLTMKVETEGVTTAHVREVQAALFEKGVAWLDLDISNVGLIQTPKGGLRPVLIDFGGLVDFNALPGSAATGRALAGLVRSPVGEWGVWLRQTVRLKPLIDFFAAPPKGGEGVGRASAFGKLQELSKETPKKDFPGVPGAIDHVEGPLRALRTIEIPPDMLGYGSELREPLAPRAELSSLAEVPKADVVEVSNVVFASEEHSGSSGLVRLAKLKDGRAVAVKAILASPPVSEARTAGWILEEANSAALFSDLGVGPKFHGIWTDGAGRLNVVMDIARGDFSGTPVKDATFADLEAIIGRLRGAGIKEVGDFQAYRTPEGRLTLIDPATAIKDRGVKPPADPDSRYGFATGQRLALFEAAPADVGARYLEGLRAKDPAAYRGLLEALPAAKRPSPQASAPPAPPAPLFDRFLRAVGLGGQAVPELPITVLGSGEAGVVLRFQRPGEPPLAVKVSRTGPSRLNAKAWEAFLDEPERVDSVSRAYDRRPMANFEVPRPAHPTFTPGELRALKAASGAPGEVVENGRMVVTNAVPGQTLKAYFESGGRLTPAEAKTMREGLRALNGEGYFAFDLKSDNMMVYDDPVRGRVFVLIDTGAMSFKTPKTSEHAAALARQSGLFDGMVKPFLEKPASGGPVTTQGRAVRETVPPSARRTAVLAEILSPDSALAADPGLAPFAAKLEAINVSMRRAYDELAAAPPKDADILFDKAIALRRRTAADVAALAADPTVPEVLRKTFVKAAEKYGVSAKEEAKLRKKVATDPANTIRGVLGEAAELDVSLRVSGFVERGGTIRERLLADGVGKKELLGAARDWVRAADPAAQEALLALARERLAAREPGAVIADVEAIPADILDSLTLQKEVADVVFKDGRAWGEVKNLDSVTTLEGLLDGAKGKSLFTQARENLLVSRLFGPEVREYHYFFVDGITPQAAARLQALGIIVHGIAR